MLFVLVILSETASSQPVFWHTATDGDWFDQGNWSDLNVPDVALEVGVLGFTTPYTVTLGQRNMMLGGIEITNPAAVLHITDLNSNQRVRLRGDIINEGMIRLIDDGSFNDTFLVVDTDLTFSGSGVIELEAIGDLNGARIEIEEDATLTIDPTSTIRGRGYLADGSGSIVNHGSIEGSLLVGRGGVVQNNGMIRATDPTNDMLLSGLFIAGSGQFLADEGATLDLFEATLSGVVFEDNSPGSIGAFLGNPTLIDVTSRRVIEVTAFRQFRNLFLSSTFHNDGVLRIDDPGRSFHASVTATDDTLISGDGFVELFVNPGEEYYNARIGASSNATLTIGPGQVITGQGFVGSGYGVTVLEGQIYGALRVGSADGVFINNGLVQAMPGGDDLVISGTHAPGTGAYLAESGARISLLDGVFKGLRFETSGAGTVGVYSQGATLDSIINNGTLLISNEYRRSTALLHSGIENNGVLQVFGYQNADHTILQVASDSHISGSGTIEFSVGSSISNLDDAQVMIDPGVTLTIGPHQTAQGTGQLGVGAGGILVNEGLITGGLQVGADGCVITNNGVIRANDQTHSLRLGGIHSSGQGFFAADAGCRINLFTSKLVGVIIDDVAPGSIGVYASSPILSTNTQLLSTLEVVAENSQSATLLIDSEVFNDGVIELFDRTVFGVASLSTIENGTLLGTGRIELAAEPESIDGAQVSAAVNSTLSIGSDQVISGFGVVGGDRGLVRNFGTIEGTILVGSEFGSFENHGVVHSKDLSHEIRLTGTHLPGSGVYTALNGAMLDLGDASMTGVTLDQQGDGRIGAFSADPTLSSATNLGELSVSNALGHRFLRIDSQIKNDGVIRVIDEFGVGDAVLVVESDAELSGSGSLELETSSGLDSPGLASVEVHFGSTLTIDQDQVVSGTGLFGGLAGVITNHGTVDPSGADQILRLGGNHVGGTGDYTASAGVLDLFESELDGVRLNGNGKGRIGAFMGNPHLTDVMIEGTVDVSNQNGSRFFNVYSGIQNDGVIRLMDEESPSNSVMYVRTDTLIDGKGRVELLTEPGSHPSDAQIFLFNGAECVIGSDQVIYGSGQLGSGNGSLILEGTLDPGAGLRLLELRSGLLIAESAQLKIDLGGTEPGTYDRLIASDGVLRSGHLNVQLDQGYAPTIGDSWSIIGGGAQLGSFHTQAFPSPPPGAVYRLVEGVADTQLVLACLADLNADRDLNFFDVSLFLVYFDSEDCRADLNDDGLFNFFDVSIFLTSYAEGCP